MGHPVQLSKHLCVTMLFDVCSLSFQRQKPPGYFRTLHDILKVLINFFYGDRVPQDETLMKMKGLLQGCNSIDILGMPRNLSLMIIRADFVMTTLV